MNLFVAFVAYWLPVLAALLVELFPDLGWTLLPSLVLMLLRSFVTGGQPTLSDPSGDTAKGKGRPRPRPSPILTRQGILGGLGGTLLRSPSPTREHSPNTPSTVGGSPVENPVIVPEDAEITPGNPKYTGAYDSPVNEHSVEGGLGSTHIGIRPFRSVLERDDVRVARRIGGGQTEPLDWDQVGQIIVDAVADGTVVSAVLSGPHVAGMGSVVAFFLTQGTRLLVSAGGTPGQPGLVTLVQGLSDPLAENTLIIEESHSAASGSDADTAKNRAVARLLKQFPSDAVSRQK